MLSRAEIQAARGIGIVLIVFGHLPVTTTLFVNVYIFHMPLFFFLSGMALRAGPPVSALARRDGVSLLGYAALHAGLLAALTVLVNGAFDLQLRAASPLDWRTYLLWPITQSGNHVQLFLVSWFLTALFFTRIVSLIVLKALRERPAAVTAAAVGLGWLGMAVFPPWFLVWQRWPPNLLGQACAGAMFCLLGHLAQHHLRLPRRLVGTGLLLGLYALMATVSLLLDVPAASMAWSIYPSGFLVHTLLAGLGIVCVLVASILLQGGRMLALAGAYSKQIMTYHLTVFAVVNGILIQFGSLDPAAVTVLGGYDPRALWFLYLAQALAVPVLVTMAWERRDRFALVRL